MKRLSTLLDCYGHAGKSDANVWREKTRLRDAIIDGDEEDRESIWKKRQFSQRQLLCKLILAPYELKSSFSGVFGALFGVNFDCEPVWRCSDLLEFQLQPVYIAMD